MPVEVRRTARHEARARATISPNPPAIYGAIVTHHPERGLPERAARLALQVGGLIIVDNGSSTSGIALAEEAARLTGAHLVANPANRGIATALNQAAQLAMSLGSDWLITMDQDTSACPTMVTELARAYRDCPFRDDVAVVGAGVAGAPAPGCDNTSWTEQTLVITSGSLVSLPILEAVGGFRDDFYMDYVDVEYCLRLRERGYRVIITCAPVMRHRIGKPTRHRFLSRRPVTTNHSAARRYYMTRNRLTLWLRYWRTEKAWVKYDLAWFLRETLKIALFEQDRGAKLRAVTAGIRDAALRRNGARRSAREASPHS